MGNTVLDDGEKSMELISFGIGIVGAYSVAACGQECVQRDVMVLFPFVRKHCSNSSCELTNEESDLVGVHPASYPVVMYPGYSDRGVKQIFHLCLVSSE